jgi:hypothetical protein
VGAGVNVRRSRPARGPTWPARSTPSRDGWLGRALENRVIVQVVPPSILRLPDGREIPGAFAASTYDLGTARSCYVVEKR